MRKITRNPSIPTSSNPAAELQAALSSLRHEPETPEQRREITQPGYDYFIVVNSG